MKGLKSELKTGMTVENRSGEFGKVLIGTSKGDIIGGTDEGLYETWCSFNDLSDDLIYRDGHAYNDIVRVYDFDYNSLAASTKRIGQLLWERKEEKPILELDGVEYSESTLRSIIKKATN